MVDRRLLSHAASILPGTGAYITSKSMSWHDPSKLTLAPTGVRATLVPTGGADNRPLGDLENEAS